MALVRFQILILLALFCRPLWAQDKAYILVRQIQGIETLPPSMARQLEKVSLMVVAKQPGYELILSGSDTPKGTNLEILAVEPEVSRSSDMFRVEARLIDVKTKKLLGKASRDHVREEDVVRLFQGAMEAIFAGMDSPSDESKEKDKPPKPKDRPKPVKSTTTLSSPDEPSIDFAKRIADLKVGVDKKITKVNEQKKEEEAAKKKENDAMMNQNLKAAQLEKDMPPAKPEITKVYERTHVLSLAYEDRSIKSTGLVETTTKAKAATFKASGHIPRPLFDGKTGFSYDLAYSNVRADVETPSVYQLGLYGSLLFPSWNLSVGLFRDSSFFVNLSDPGAGLQSYSITSTWQRIKGEVTLPFSKPWKLSASWGKPHQVASSYKQVADASAWSGTHININLTPHFVVLTCEVNIMLETLNLSTQGEVPFTFNESRLGLSLRRSL